MDNIRDISDGLARIAGRLNETNDILESIRKEFAWNRTMTPKSSLFALHAEDMWEIQDWTRDDDKYEGVIAEIENVFGKRGYSEEDIINILKIVFYKTGVIARYQNHS